MQDGLPKAPAASQSNVLWKRMLDRQPEGQIESHEAFVSMKRADRTLLWKTRMTMVRRQSLRCPDEGFFYRLRQ